MANLAKNQCTICDKTYQRKQQLDSHIGTHFEVKRFQCQHCQKLFTWGNDCKQHEKEVHLRASQVRCSHCKTPYACLRSFARHLKRQTGKSCRAAQAKPIPISQPLLARQPPGALSITDSAFEQLSTDTKAEPPAGIGPHTSLSRKRKFREQDSDDCDEEFISPLVARSTRSSRTLGSWCSGTSNTGATSTYLRGRNVMSTGTLDWPSASNRGLYQTHDPMTSTLLDHFGTVDIVGVLWQATALGEFCWEVLGRSSTEEQILAWIYQSCVTTTRKLLARTCRSEGNVREIPNESFVALWNAVDLMGKLAHAVGDKTGHDRHNRFFWEMLDEYFRRRADNIRSYHYRGRTLVHATNLYKPCVTKTLLANGWEGITEKLKPGDETGYFNTYSRWTLMLDADSCLTASEYTEYRRSSDDEEDIVSNTSEDENESDLEDFSDMSDLEDLEHLNDPDRPEPLPLPPLQQDSFITSMDLTAG